MRTLVYTAFVLCLVVPVSGLADESAPTDGPAFAREGRVSFAFNFDYGFVDMPGFNEYASQLNQQGQPKGYDDLSGVMGFEMALRYYAPYYIFAQLGVGAVVGHQDYQLEIGASGVKVEYWNLIMEIPILIGGHYPVHDRIHLHLALGPSVLVIPSSYWDQPNGGLPDFDGDSGVGFQARLGADFYALENLAFGLELLYRMAEADVVEDEGKKVIVGGQLVDGYAMDFSGFGFKVGFRLAL